MFKVFSTTNFSLNLKRAQRFCTAQDTIKNEKATYGWEKYFQNLYPISKVTSKIYKRNSHNSKNNQLKNEQKNLKIYFPK